MICELSSDITCYMKLPALMRRKRRKNSKGRVYPSRAVSEKCKNTYIT